MFKIFAPIAIALMSVSTLAEEVEIKVTNIQGEGKVWVAICKTEFCHNLFRNCPSTDKAALKCDKVSRNSHLKDSDNYEKKELKEISGGEGVITFDLDPEGEGYTIFAHHDTCVNGQEGEMDFDKKSKMGFSPAEGYALQNGKKSPEAWSDVAFFPEEESEHSLEIMAGNGNCN